MITMELVEDAFHAERVSIFELRARYSRALSRAAYLLGYHGKGRAPISPYPLVYLLESVCLAAQCTDLNPSSCLSTNQPQLGDGGVPPQFEIHVIGTGMLHYLHPEAIGDRDAIVAGITRILSYAGIEETPHVEFAAASSLALIGPLLFGQWMNMKQQSGRLSSEQVEALAFSERMMESWPTEFETYRLQHLAAWSLSQLLILSIVAVRHAGCFQMNDLPDTAIGALYHRANALSGRAPVSFIATNDRDLTLNLIQFTVLNHQELRHMTLHFLLLLSLIEFKGTTLFRKAMFHPIALPQFLHLLSRVPGHIAEVQLVFKELGHMLHEGSDPNWNGSYQGGDYLSVFTRQDEGFTALIGIGKHREYVSTIADFIETIVHIAAERCLTDPYNPGALLACAAPGLLNAIKFAVDHTKYSTKDFASFISVIRDTITLLHTLHGEGAVSAANHPATNEIHSALAGALGYEEISGILAEWEEIQGWKDLGCWQLTGLSQLFDMSG
jgi:hypothetical protein